MSDEFRKALDALTKARRSRDRNRLLALHPRMPSLERTQLLLDGAEMLIRRQDEVLLQILSGEARGQYLRALQQERAKRPRKSRRSPQLIAEVRRLWRKHEHSGQPEEDRAKDIQRTIAGGGFHRWRKGPNGQFVGIKTIRAIIRSLGLRKEKNRERLAG